MGEIKENQITWKSWVALIIMIILFSGIFQKSEGFLKAFDFSNLCGKFGVNARNQLCRKGWDWNSRGLSIYLYTHSDGVSCCGTHQCGRSAGGMQASEKLFNPLLRPLLGIPGIAGVSFVASFTSSDITAVMTKQLVEEEAMTDDERTVYVAYQYAGSAVILNTINTQAPLLPLVLLALGPILVVEIFCKLLGANLVRVYLHLKNHKSRSVGYESVR